MGEHYEKFKLGDFLEKGEVFQNKVKESDSHWGSPSIIRNEQNRTK